MTRPPVIDCRFYFTGICTCVCICSSECIEVQDEYNNYNKETKCEIKIPRKK